MNTISTPQAPAAIGPYSQAVLSGSLVYTSGQIPIDPATGRITAVTIEDQAEQCCKNILAILAAAGTDASRVIKTTCFLADMEDFTAFNAVYEKYFISKPVRSCVEVSRLPKDVLCEIEAIAEGSSPNI